MFSFLTQFQDPRYRKERLFIVILLPVTLALIYGMYFLFTRDQGAPPDIQPLTEAQIQASREKEEETVMPPPPPEAPIDRINRARMAYNTGDFEGTRKIMADVDLKQVASSTAWTITGLLQLESGNKAAAMEAFTQGIITVPSAELYYQRALLLRSDQDLAKTLADLDKAAELSPADIVVSNERLLLLIQMGRKEDARGELTTKIQANPSGESWIFGVAGLALEQGQFSEAAQVLGRARDMVDARTFQKMMENPMIEKFQNQEDITPFFFRNLPE